MVESLLRIDHAYSNGGIQRKPYQDFIEFAMKKETQLKLNYFTNFS